MKRATKLKNLSKLLIRNKITSWWHLEGKYTGRNFRIGMRNLRKWFPIIWKNRDWDYRYIYQLLLFKLEEQQSHLVAHSSYVNSEYHTGKIEIAKRLLTKVMDEFYNVEYLDYCGKITHFEPHNKNGRIYYTLESELIEDRFEDYFKRYPRIYRKVISREIKCFGNELSRHNVAMTISSYNHVRARRILFKFLEHNIEGWWN